VKKKVVIFGATSGLGFSFAKIFIEKNYQVISISSSKNGNLKSFKNYIHYKCDLSIDKDVNKVIKYLIANKSSIELFIFCSARLTVGSFCNIPEKKFDDDIKINALSFIKIIRCYLNINKKNFKLICILSNLSLSGAPNLSSYCVSKAILKNFSESLNLELKNSKILMVYPGSLSTNLNQKAEIFGKNISFDSKLKKKNTDDVAKSILYNFYNNKKYFFSLTTKIIYLLKFISVTFFDFLLKRKY